MFNGNIDQKDEKNSDVEHIIDEQAREVVKDLEERLSHRKIAEIETPKRKTVRWRDSLKTPSGANNQSLVDKQLISPNNNGRKPRRSNSDDNLSKSIIPVKSDNTIIEDKTERQI